ncbi:MAG: ABC transporter permease [Parachlamydiales bacterium]|jgi:peptide/nickel transport system permease protein
MGTYILRRLILLPITLFCIILVNFIVLNLAPGEPTTRTEISPEGNASRSQSNSQVFTGDDRYLQFREFYGLTLPILFNTWPSTTQESVDLWLWQIVHEKVSPENPEPLAFKDFQNRRVEMGDRARFIMPKLLHVINDPQADPALRKTAVRFFVRGGSPQAFLGPTLTADQKAYNRKIGKENNFLASFLTPEKLEDLPATAAALTTWYQEHYQEYHFEPSGMELVSVFITQTRFYRYMSRVLTLDFGTLRNDSNKTVFNEVTKRFKYSLTLSVIPMWITLFLCVFFGFLMALRQNKPIDYSLNVLFLVLYATPVFVVAPFLIEKVALHHHFPFTDIPIPLGGFTSREEVYGQLTSWGRLWDTMQHIALPLVALLYGSLAAQTRLSRTAVLEVMRQDYVRTAFAKGLPRSTVYVKHIGRNASITIVTSIAASLGAILGGSLIVETLFQIDGFGKFFYDAIVNRDYNVVMFSALAGAFLSLMGYLIADLSYAFLDPRLKLD